MMKNQQLKIEFSKPVYNRKDIVNNIRSLIRMYNEGDLGGENMPEDVKPKEISINSSENYHFLTLPMALNYQRNSYTLWKSAALTYLDINTRDVFSPSRVTLMSTNIIREKLMKHKVALQPVRHVENWKRLCDTIMKLLKGDIRNLFVGANNDVVKIRDFVQKEYKKEFPYLSGHKIFNYWLHVIEIYTPTKLKNRSEITVAPDTHIIQSSLRLGLIEGTIEEISKNRTKVSEQWEKVLAGTNLFPIDIHTPLWLWSKANFPPIKKY